MQPAWVAWQRLARSWIDCLAARQPSGPFTFFFFFCGALPSVSRVCTAIVSCVHFADRLYANSGKLGLSCVLVDLWRRARGNRQQLKFGLSGSPYAYTYSLRILSTRDLRCGNGDLLGLLNSPTTSGENTCLSQLSLRRLCDPRHDRPLGSTADIVGPESGGYTD